MFLRSTDWPCCGLESLGTYLLAHVVVGSAVHVVGGPLENGTLVNGLSSVVVLKGKLGVGLTHKGVVSLAVAHDVMTVISGYFHFLFLLKVINNNTFV